MIVWPRRLEALPGGLPNRSRLALAPRAEHAGQEVTVAAAAASGVAGGGGGACGAADGAASVPCS